MRLLKLTITFSLSLLFVYCQKKEKKIVSSIKKTSIQINITDTLINSIDSTRILNLDTKKEKIIELFFKSLDNDYTKPLINFSSIKNSQEKIEVKKYVNFNINKNKYQSYLISFSYENDELYRSILLTNSNLDDALLIYEKVIDEGEYLRISRINKNIVKSSVFQIEHFKYDNEGNISNEKAIKDSLVVSENKYLLNENYFLEYFAEDNLNLNKQWGEKEIIYTKDRLDSSFVYLYEKKGKIKNHLKTGNWEERRYINIYNKSVWLNGEYVKGLKNGEWNYSPDGPVDKVEVYNMGKLIKTYFP
ncbi:hypothetical protein [Flavobacterium sp.]|uniref:hypothetical protein n=1 Tax=Flavobacterium sp. TaxID=239 RepID=UPI003D0D6512